MYSITKNIKILSFSMMLIGLLALAYGFYSAPHTLEEAKEMVSNHGYDDHGSNYGEEYNSNSTQKKDKTNVDLQEDSHKMSHDEHVYLSLIHI